MTTREWITLSQSTDRAPVWAGSVAASHAGDPPYYYHGLVLVAAHTESEARIKALRMALKKWTLADGWEQHTAEVANVYEAVEEWNALSNASTT